MKIFIKISLSNGSFAPIFWIDEFIFRPGKLVRYPTLGPKHYFHTVFEAETQSKLMQRGKNGEREWGTEAGSEISAGAKLRYLPDEPMLT